MKALNRVEAADWVRQHAAALDAEGQSNPFALAEWTLHFLGQVARDDWAIFAPQTGSGGMLLYAEPQQSTRLLALTNYYASLWSPACDADTDSATDAAAAGLVAQLQAHRPRTATVQLAPLSAEAASTAALERAFKASGWYTSRYFCFGNWTLPCDGLDFDAYMQARDSRLLNTWRRKSKAFYKSADSGTRIQIVTDLCDVEMAIAAYNSIYAKSWKKPEPYPGFVSGWARICARNGWLRLGLAWVDGVPVAAQFWFTVNRRAYIFKLAYDEEHAKLSAGTVLSAHLFRHSLAQDRVVEIDYLTGDDAYKQGWMTQRRERMGLLACNPATAAGLYHAGRQVAVALRQRLAPRTPAAADAPA